MCLNGFAQIGGGVMSQELAGGWPPSPLDELAELLAGIRSGRRVELPHNISLFDTSQEVDSWLGDSRRYNRNFKRTDEWASLAEDFRAAIDCRGPLLRGRTAGLDAIAAALHDDLGRDNAARVLLRADLKAAGAALADTRSRTAAFDDLLEVVNDPHSSHREVTQRFSVLNSSLAFANRSMSTLASTLTGIARDDPLDVASARRTLDRIEIPEDLLNPRHEKPPESGLGVVERLDLIRRLLSSRPTQHNHAVWVFYGRARFDTWIFKVGPVTFIDGPALMGVFDQLDQSDDAATTLANFQNTPWFGDLPEEVTHGENAQFLRWKHNWPDNIDQWVAARVYLGPGPHLDPVGEARRQADALVGLARFHGNSTNESWVGLTGHLEIVDGERRGASWPIREPEPITSDS